MFDEDSSLTNDWIYNSYLLKHVLNFYIMVLAYGHLVIGYQRIVIRNSLMSARHLSVTNTLILKHKLLIPIIAQADIIHGIHLVIDFHQMNGQIWLWKML